MSKKVITFYDSEKQSHDFPIITPDYGTCSTASNTSAKVVTCDDFSLFTGAEITVKFTNVPTTNTITLNVNNSGAKNVDFSACGNKPYDEIKANGCYGFVYDGTSWIYKGSGKGASKEELERLQYYDNKDIIPSDESYFTVNSTGETITGLTDTGKTQTELVIPYKINGIEITTLFSGRDAINDPPRSILYNNNTITKVVVPNSVTTLGIGAFYECSSLTSVNIPNSVTSIGTYAFAGCSSLTLVNIPNNVTSIGDDVFNGCTSLKSINIPNSVTSIGIGTFYHCSSLTSIDIPNSVTSIKQSAFRNCTSLRSINIPNSVTSIESNAFRGCTKLNTIYCGKGSYAEGYATVNDIPVIYTDISATDFDNKADKSTTLDGYGITDASHITTSQFDASTAANANLGDIHINTATGRVFICSYVNPGKEVLWTLLPITTSDINTDSDGYVLDVKTLKTKLSDINESINTGLNEKIGKSSIVNDLKTNSALAPLSAAQGVVLKGLVDNKAEQVELERLEYYGDKDIIPSDESYFTVNATGETITGLTDTGKTQTELVIPYKINGKLITTLYSGETMKSILGARILSSKSEDTIVRKIVIPNSITSIGDYALNRSKALISINIPNGVTSISNGAFESCNSLKSVKLPDSITSITNNAFAGCSSLASINIPNGVTSIGENAFESCTSLTSINIPNSVTSIGNGAFIVYDEEKDTEITNPNLTIYCEQGSYAETYAKANNIPVIYTDIKSLLSGKVTTITVPTTGWTTSTDTNGTTYYSINITDSILTSTGYPITDVVLPSDIAAARLQSEAYQNVNKITVNDGSVDLYCFDSLPTVSFQIRIQLLYI